MHLPSERVLLDVVAPNSATDVLAGFVLARSAAGLSSDVVHLEQTRAWLGRPLWEMEPADADLYLGKVMRDAAKGTRLARAQALKTYFLFVSVDRTTGRHAGELRASTS